MATAEPSAAVVAVVLVHEDVTHVAACVRSILASSSVSPQVLVVDNGSSARARAELAAVLAPFRGGVESRPRVGDASVAVHETHANLGYAGGNNVGLAMALAAGARYVLVLNDDTTIAADAVARLVAALESDPRAAAASPSMVHAEAPARVWWAGGALDRLRAIGTHETSPARLHGAPRAVGCLCGCAILFRAAALRALGTFDASYFMYGEDVEWSLRAAQAGWRLLHVPEAHLAHAVPYPEPPAAAWKIRFRDRNRRRLVRTHFGRGARWRFGLWFYPTRMLRLAAYLLRADWARAAAVGRGMVER